MRIHPYNIQSIFVHHFLSIKQLDELNNVYYVYLHRFFFVFDQFILRKRLGKSILNVGMKKLFVNRGIVVILILVLSTIL